MDESIQLSSKLGQLLNIPPISIELLPGDGSEWLLSAPATHAPFLFIDDNLGVPHKVAYKAYLQAVVRFRPARLRDGPDVASEVLTSTAVLLLVNPAHQTALNARKRLVLAGSSLSASHELRFTDALLMMREGAKQSVLWAHRRWLLRHIYPLAPLAPRPSADVEPLSQSQGDGVDTLFGLALDAPAFQREFSVVERACEAYPRNYHAWAHRFLCAEALVALLHFQRASHSEPPPQELVEVLSEERERVREWIERHVSDYSAMQYCCRLEGLVRGCRVDAALGRSSAASAEVYAHALELVKAFPGHESLWLYLRGAVSVSLPFGSCEERGEKEVWELIGVHLASTGATHESVAAHAHAVRFAAWKIWLVRAHDSSGLCGR
ncbi:protein prenylyltransferase [Dichomitus squalens LYAD-421 SS1]|uniref:Protein prenylyltransferase n=1 Tax=Dichomitus squalens (strain LYAD-421) TaxID=732165 RepID=R7SRH0_DICSQ|nr:protein prenylyltransferase [Dichomitus squalens LYAD-421 SS1]EJF57567.1 protein prenylyltransferase [Dichomitus squalens LYAD-421 SS1]